MTPLLLAVAMLAQTGVFLDNTFCRPFPLERVRQTPGGYYLLGPDGQHDRRVVPRAGQSPDHQFWICQPAGEPVSHVFAPVPTS